MVLMSSGVLCRSITSLIGHFPEMSIELRPCCRAYVVRKNRNVLEQDIIDYVSEHVAPHKR